MRTYEKIEALRDALLEMDPDEMPPAARDFALNLQIAKGMGFDPFDLVMPDDPGDVDEMIDGAIHMLLDLRGDDLPRFDFGRHLADPEPEPDPEAAA